MVSNGGPEAVGVWKSLLEWECRAWGSTQRSAPETAPRPSCHVHQNAQGDPATQIYQPHTQRTHFDCDHWETLCCKEGDLPPWKCSKSVTLLKVNLICCVSSLVVVGANEFLWILKWGYLRLESILRGTMRRQQKQKTWKKPYCKLLEAFRAIVEKWWQRCDIAR